ncbi:hypothetical protein ABB26_12775, partial [Stenotrophomonas humi]
TVINAARRTRLGGPSGNRWVSFDPIKSPADQGGVDGAGERVFGEESPLRDLLQGMGEIRDRYCACRGL